MYRILSLAAILFFIFTSFTYALSYSITGLGTLGGNYSVANGINNNGQVVGFSYIPDPSTGYSRQSAFLYDGTIGMQSIGTLGGYYHMSVANDINDNGQVVGSSYNTHGDLRAFVYDPTTGMKEIVSTGTSSEAYSINNSGQVAGYDSIGLADGKWHAYVYDPIAGVQFLFHSGEIESAAYGINDSGQVAGMIRTTSNRTIRYSFLYDPLTELQKIGSSSYATDINNNGQAIGFFRSLVSQENHAFIYDTTTGLQDIGTLGGNLSRAQGINDHGQVVGYSTILSENGYHAFLYDTISGIQDLNDFIDDDLWTIVKANDINQYGQIVGYGIYDGNHQAFLMTPDIEPVPEPATFILLVSGLVGLIFYRKW